MTAWRTGDSVAGRQLFDRYLEPVVRFFRRKVDRDAEDLVQRTFLAVVQGKARFRGGSVRSFIFAIAQHVLYEHLREKKRSSRIDFGVSSMRDLAPGLGTVMSCREEHRRLTLALQTLCLDDQITLELYYIERMTAAEIAQVVGVGESGVRGRLRRAKERLALALAANASPSTSDGHPQDLDAWAAMIAELR